MADDFLGEWEAFRAAARGAADRAARLPVDHRAALARRQRRSGTTARPAPGGSAPTASRSSSVRDEALTVDGREIRGHQVLGPVDESGIRASAGDVEIEVARRDSAVLLRPRDPAHALRAGHRPTPTFPPVARLGRARDVPRARRRPADRRSGRRGRLQVAGEPVRLVGVRRRRRAVARVRRRDRRAGRRTAPAGSSTRRRRPPTAASSSTSTAPSTCRAPTPTSRPARSRCRRTG